MSLSLIPYIEIPNFIISTGVFLLKFIFVLFFCFGGLIYAEDPVIDDNMSSPNCNFEKEKLSVEYIFQKVKENVLDTNITELFKKVSSESELLVIGERHPDSTPKTTLIDHIELLSKNGFNVLALEMVNKSSQEDLKLFCSGHLSRASFEPIWRDNWPYKKQANNYLNLIRKACDEGFEVFAVDERDHPDLTKRPQSNMNWRNKVMANNITEIYQKKPDAKVVFLTGYIHGLTSPLNNVGELTKHFVGNTSVNIEILKLIPQLKISSINIARKFPIVNITLYCSHVSYLRKLEKHFPGKSQLIFAGTSVISFDYIYLDLSQ